MDLTGATELQATLHSYRTDQPRGSRLAGTVVSAGARKLKTLIQRSAPDRKLRNAVGSRRVIARGEITAKAGMNVGRKRNRAPLAHIRLLGTKNRRTRSGANRGRIKGNNFVATTTQTAAGPVTAEMQTTLNDELRT